MDSKCPNCEEEVNVLKILPCSHEICPKCLQASLQTSPKNPLCPRCNKTFEFSAKGLEALPSKCLGSLTCDFCLKSKDIGEFWWCEACIKVFCSRCDVTEHRKLAHSITPWDSKDGVRFCLRFLRQYSEMLSLSKYSSLDSNSSKAISEFLEKVKTELTKKIWEKSLSHEDKAKMESVRNVLQSLYGVPEPSGSFESISWDEDKQDKIRRVIDQALKLAAVESEPFPSIKEQKLSDFAISPEEAAKYLMDRADVVERKVDFQKVESEAKKQAAKANETKVEEIAKGVSKVKISKDQAKAKPTPEPKVTAAPKAEEKEKSFANSPFQITHGSNWKTAGLTGVNLVRSNGKSVVVGDFQARSFGIWNVKQRNATEYIGSLRFRPPPSKFAGLPSLSQVNEFALTVALFGSTLMCVSYTLHLGGGTFDVLVGVAVFLVSQGGGIKQTADFPVFPKTGHMTHNANICADGEYCFLGSSWALTPSGKDNFLHLHKIKLSEETPSAVTEIKAGFQDIKETQNKAMYYLDCVTIRKGAQHFIAMNISAANTPAATVDPMASGTVFLLLVEGDRVTQHKMLKSYHKVAPLTRFRCWPVTNDKELRALFVLNGNLYYIDFYESASDVTALSYTTTLKYLKKVEVGGSLEGSHDFLSLSPTRIRSLTFTGKAKNQIQFQDVDFTWGGKAGV